MQQHLASASGLTMLQVEGLCSMVSGVEELVAKAEKHCTAMQVKPRDYKHNLTHHHQILVSQAVKSRFWSALAVTSKHRSYRQQPSLALLNM